MERPQRFAEAIIIGRPIVPGDTGHRTGNMRATDTITDITMTTTGQLACT